MKKINTSILSILGAFLIILFCLLSCEKDDWQDHLTDPGLGGETENGGDPWIGSWNFVYWSVTDAEGNIIEGPEEFEPGSEGGLTLNEDGTYTFTGFGDNASGNYTVEDNVLTMEGLDEWWGQPWNISFDDDGNMLMGMGEWPTREGEGYKLVAQWVGTWNFISWWATDATGATVEGPEDWNAGDEGGFTLNEDRTFSFNGLGFAAEGNYTVSDGVLTFEGVEDEWWGQPWNISFDDDGNMLMGMGDWPTGEGEGYVLQREE